MIKKTNISMETIKESAKISPTERDRFIKISI